MRHLFIISMILIMNSASAQTLPLDLLELKNYEHQLEDVMELVDKTELLAKIEEVERDYEKNPDEINTVRLGIIYHETALNLSFLSKTEFKGYAKKSYEILTKLSVSPGFTKELDPFVVSYSASALSLVAAETNKLKLLGSAFAIFGKAVDDYAAVSYLPEFLRGSVAENLPWFFFLKRKAAKHDFQSIVDKFERNPDYANSKVMSFTYWASAKQKQSKTQRLQSLSYLDKAIALDPDFKAGRAKAEELKATMIDR